MLSSGHRSQMKICRQWKCDAEVFQFCWRQRGEETRVKGCSIRRLQSEFWLEQRSQAAMAGRLSSCTGPWCPHGRAFTRHRRTCIHSPTPHYSSLHWEKADKATLPHNPVWGVISFRKQSPHSTCSLNATRLKSPSFFSVFLIPTSATTRPIREQTRTNTEVLLLLV